MIRWIKELFDSSLKCKRLGHNIQTSHFRVRKQSYEWRKVVADFKATQRYCKRCGHREPVEIGKEIQGYSSCSMPSYMWDEMRENGFIRVN